MADEYVPTYANFQVYIFKNDWVMTNMLKTARLSHYRLSFTAGWHMMRWWVLSHYQGWRIRGFEGARAPPEQAGAPSHCQKHPLKTKEKDHKAPFKNDI